MGVDPEDRFERDVCMVGAAADAKGSFRTWVTTWFRALWVALGEVVDGKDGVKVKTDVCTA